MGIRISRAVWVLLLALLGHWLFFVGVIVSDDTLYLAQAQQYLSGDASLPTSHWGFRYTVVLPTALVVALLGLSEQTLALVPLGYWMALLLLMLWFARRELGERAAWIAGALTATLPLLVIQSSILGADNAEALFLFGCFVVFYLAETSDRPDWRTYVGAGLLLGLAMLTRETAYGFLLVLALFFLLGGWRRWPYYLAGLAGVLAILSLEWAYYLAFDQGLLYRIETITGTHGGVGKVSGDFDAGSGNISDDRLLGPLLAVLVNEEFALLFWAGIAAAIYLWRHGHPEHRRLLFYIGVAFAGYFLWLGYGGAIRPLPRYFTFLAVLAVLPVALALQQMRVAWLRWLLLAGLFGANVGALSTENIHARFASRAVGEYALASNLPVVSDDRTAYRARVYLKFAGADRDQVSDQAPGTGGYVLARVQGWDGWDWEAPPGSSTALKQQQPAAVARPPKLLIGHLLDLSGVAGLLPQGTYHFLAVRNPQVRFYRITD